MTYTTRFPSWGRVFFVGQRVLADHRRHVPRVTGHDPRLHARRYDAASLAESGSGCLSIVVIGSTDQTSRMALNLWWFDQRHERFWMEITDREVLGDNLTALQLDSQGREQWSSTLITETQPGDIVLHWHRPASGRPAIVGWSEVTGPLSVGSLTWQAHGTRGRARGVPSTGPSWTMQCGGFNALPRPITLDWLNSRVDDVREVYQDLERRFAGSLYLPFSFYRPHELRASQAYLTKFPAALVERLGVRVAPGPAEATATSPITCVRKSVGVPRQLDPEVRRAIEFHAVEMARSHYLQRGASRVEVLGKPYDLLVFGLGPVRHVEVKGSSVEAVAVELTINEVAHAVNFVHTDLIVVDGVGWQRTESGNIATNGGRLRCWQSWRPAEEDLSVTRYRYELPATDDLSTTAG